MQKGNQNKSERSFVAGSAFGKAGPWWRWALPYFSGLLA
jgi:hypothetical protein